MLKDKSGIKEHFSTFSKPELLDVVLKLASKKENYDFLLVNYIDTQSGEKDLFEKAKFDIDALSMKRYKGYAEQQKLANMLSSCTKRINEFVKISKNKQLEADLILYVLEIPFSYSAEMFGTCFTGFDYKVGLLVKRLITLVTKKMHLDYKIEYREKINAFLLLLHQRSNHLDSIYNLPQLMD